MASVSPLDAAFAKALEAAHAALAKSGHFPRLDDSDFLATLEPLLDSLLWARTELGNLDGRESIPVTVKYRRHVDVDALPMFDGDVAGRCVVAALLYHEALQDHDDAESDHAMAVDHGHADEGDYNDPGVDFSKLQTFLAGQSMGEVPDGALLWETHASAICGFVTRLVALADQISIRLPTAEGLEIASRCLFLSLQQPPHELPSDAWLPSWSTALPGEIYELIAVGHATAPIARSLQDLLLRRPLEQVKTDVAHVTAVTRLRGWLEQLRLQGSLSREHATIFAYTGFILGVTSAGTAAASDAGDHFYTLASDRALFPGPSPVALRASAACFIRAGRADKAERPLRDVVEVMDDPSSAQMDLMLCYYLQNKEREAHEALVRLAELDGRYRDDAMTSLALQFGQRAAERSRTQEFLVAAAMASPTRAQAEALIEWLDPFYAQLSHQTKQQWWSGLFLLSQPDFREGLGEDTWNKAGAAFGEAVNHELRIRIFKPFVKTLQPGVRDEVGRSGKTDRTQVIRGKGGLGQHIRLLEDTRSPARDDALAQSLDTWLSQHASAFHGQLPALMRNHKANLMLRNEAAHNSIDRVEAQRVFQSARELLRTLVRIDSR